MASHHERTFGVVLLFLVLVSAPAYATPDEGGATTVSGGGSACENCAESLAKGIADLRRVIDAGTRKPFGEVASAIARRLDLEHDAKILARGCGKFIGSRAYRGPDVPRDVRVTDCTTYVIDVLREAFASHGKSAQFERVMARAHAASPNGFQGTELIKALQAEMGWTGIFWAPDPNTDDAGGEHKYAAYLARTKGTYYRIPVDRAKAVVGYRPEDPSKTPDTRNLEKLKKLPFGIVAAKGGMHMALVLNGRIYEVHWAEGCESGALIEDKEISEWIWNSGIIAAPKDEIDRAWGMS